MIDWMFVLVCSLMVPGIMVACGWWFGAHPPQKINHFCGYRTRMAMKNMDTWIFAHKTASALWLRWGSWMLLPSIAIMAAGVWLRPENLENIGIALLFGQMAGLLASLYPVEKALRETFDSDGNRRKN